MIATKLMQLIIGLSNILNNERELNEVWTYKKPIGIDIRVNNISIVSTRHTNR